MLRHVLTLPCNGRRHYGLFTTLHSKIQAPAKLFLSKSSIKMLFTVKNFRQPVAHFQNRLQLLQTVTGFLDAV